MLLEINNNIRVVFICKIYFITYTILILLNYKFTFLMNIFRVPNTLPTGCYTEKVVLIKNTNTSKKNKNISSFYTLSLYQ